jgi:FMN phosphatase YigB (HAD superfamily)
MATIAIDNKEQLDTLRELVGEDNLFPYTDFPIDENTIIGITLYRKDPDAQYPNSLDGSREFLETRDGFLPSELREKIIKALWRINPNPEVIEKLKKLGVTLIYPDGKKKGWIS